MSDIFGEAASSEAESGTERPLSDQERAVVTRLLSDPFAFPMQFKTWLISFLEGSDLLLPRSSVQGLSDLLGSGGGQGVLGLLPAGLILPFGGAAAPTGALLCNGAAYGRTAYKRLYDAIGTTFGAPDANNFNVPDLRRRIPWGAGASVAVGASDGKAETSRHIDHHHFFQDTKTVNVSGSTGGGGSHSHSLPGRTGQTFNIRGAATGTQVPYLEGVDPASTGGVGDHSHGFSGSGTAAIAGDTQGGFEANHPSYLVVGFIINY